MAITQTIYKNISIREFESLQPKEVLITIHGFAGDKESSVIFALGRKLTKININVVSFDLPCHGLNSANKTLDFYDCLKSLETIVAYTKTKYKNIPISFFATSFGGYLLLHYLKFKTDSFGHIILRAPAINMDSVLSDNILPAHGFSIKDLNNKIDLGYENPLYIDSTFLAQLKNNSLNDYSTKNYKFEIIQGLKDDIVDPNVVINFINKLNNDSTLYAFENADHRFKNPGELEKIISITKNILTKKD